METNEVLSEPNTPDQKVDKVYELIRDSRMWLAQDNAENAKLRLADADRIILDLRHGPSLDRSPKVAAHYSSEPPYWTLPALWSIGDHVRIQFPGNGDIGYGKVVKIAFTASYEPLYDVEVPFKMDEVVVHTRIHGIREWHLRSADDEVAERFAKD